MPKKSIQKKAGRPKKVAAIDLARWTILIPWETRIAVKKAAERSKIPLNTWIDKALLDSAREVIKGKQEVAKPEDVMDLIKNMAEKIDKLSQEVNKPWWRRFR